FSARDGMGITLLQRAGIITAIITSENTPIVTKRAAKLKIQHVILGSHEKHTALRGLADTLGMELENVCFIGDDVNDAFAIQAAGFSAAPADATDYIKSRVSYVTHANGGYGAVREVAEMILQAQSKPVSLPEQW
ncbi:MAG: HAD hydrolase family protein, partial [Candidatus Kapabacteria bacterium]|nr:HAD hydrolase family protein [Candidatus Kapabacteria bacterium]